MTKLVFEAMDLMSGHREIYDIEIEKDQYRVESDIKLPEGKYRIFITDPVTNRILGRSELFEVQK
ncbi:MAG: hypothetical protein K8I03_02490 [Ignavibacteria bacterium]|nr:hypothetical protein [Ignavibacteria bacterium]